LAAVEFVVQVLDWVVLLVLVEVLDVVEDSEVDDELVELSDDTVEVLDDAVELVLEPASEVVEVGATLELLTLDGELVVTVTELEEGLEILDRTAKVEEVEEAARVEPGANATS
jgi:hypothetical protein